MRLLQNRLILLVIMLLSFKAYSQTNILDTDSLKLGAKNVPAKFSMGGAIRLNYSWQTYNQERKDKGGDFGFELFRIDADGECDNIYFSVQYRWYENFEAIHHGYFGYHLSPNLDMDIGIHQVPFGILPYASHSFWFGGTYYLGFEDDYDTGIKLKYTKDQWTVHAAFYKNPEFLDHSRMGRYSFDIVTEGDQTNQEINQFNLRLARDFIPVDGMVINMGASLEGGSIYNQTTRGKGDRYAAALHADFKYRDWNVQLQGIDYSFNPQNPPGIDNETIQMGAFMYPFMIAAKGRVLSFNVAKKFKLDMSLIDDITFYNDFTIIEPIGSDVHTSIQNVTGFLIVKKGLYMYTDWITGQNMWFAGGSGIGLNQAEADKWLGRININFGYYFSSNTCR